jgi:hypothetical protein
MWNQESFISAIPNYIFHSKQQKFCMFLLHQIRAKKVAKYLIWISQREISSWLFPPNHFRLCDLLHLHVLDIWSQFDRTEGHLIEEINWLNFQFRDCGLAELRSKQGTYNTKGNTVFCFSVNWRAGLNRKQSVNINEYTLFLKWSIFFEG